MIERLKRVPPMAWLGGALAVSLVFLVWHQYAGDDTDTDWTTPKETQAPVVAPFPVTPGQHGSGAPMDCGPGFRCRSYAGSLVSADFSAVVGA